MSYGEEIERMRERLPLDRGCRFTAICMRTTIEVLSVDGLGQVSVIERDVAGLGVTRVLPLSEALVMIDRMYWVRC